MQYCVKIYQNTIQSMHFVIFYESCQDASFELKYPFSCHKLTESTLRFICYLSKKNFNNLKTM